MFKGLTEQQNWLLLAVFKWRMLLVFQKSVLTKTLGSKVDEATLRWRGLYNEEVNYLYSSNTVRVKKPRRIDRRGMQYV